MTDDSNDERSDEETPLDGLYADASPSESLEDRTMDHLHRRGLLAASRTSRQEHAGRMLVAAALVVLGFALGRIGGAEREASSGHRYMLLLFEGPGFQAPTSGTDDDLVVGEYRDWALRLAAEGRAVTGERLGRERRIISPPNAPSVLDPAGRLEGFFLVDGESLEEAVRLAESHPHRRYGGTIEVRALDSSE